MKFILGNTNMKMRNKQWQITVLVRSAAKSIMKLSNCIATVGRGIRKVVIENEFVRKPKRERERERDYH
jgi:hypothetical protein